LEPCLLCRIRLLNVPTWSFAFGPRLCRLAQRGGFFFCEITLSTPLDRSVGYHTLAVGNGPVVRESKRMIQPERSFS